MQPQAATEKSITIQWHPELLGRLFELVSRQLNPGEQPRECGGLLVGTVVRYGNRVHIIVRLFTPIACNYEDGQLFHLSNPDKSSLRQSLASHISPFWSCIGFYRSHYRPGLELDEEDLRLAREHLRDPPNIFLLVAANGPQGGLFLFDGLEFSREPALLLSPELQQNPSAGVSQPPVSYLGDPVPRGLAALARQLQEVVEPARKRASTQFFGFVAGLARRGMPGWLACTVILLVIGLVVVWNRREPESNREIKNSAPLQTNLGLVTSVERDHIRIVWNPHAPSVARASNGTLLVTEGKDHASISLDKNLLEYGSVVYYPTRDVVTFQLRIGDVTESLVAAGLDKIDARQPLPERAEEREPVRQETTSSQARRNTPAQLGQRRSPPLARDSGSERIRSKYQAPPSFRSALPAPELLQPPDLGLANNTTFVAVARLPVSIPLPPPPPQNRPESAVPEPSEHVDFVAAQTIKHVSPQASGSAVRLLVTNVTIQVQVHINSQGKVVRADSLSHGGTLIEYLSHLSVNAAREWLFTPARREGREVDSETVLQFIFDNKGIESSP
jgi:hypothetical protein